MFKIIFGKKYKEIDSLPLTIKQSYQILATVEHFDENETNYVLILHGKLVIKLNISRRKKKHATKSSEFIANKIFNMLPNELKAMKVSKKTKKKKLSIWLKNNTIICIIVFFVFLLFIINLRL